MQAGHAGKAEPGVDIAIVFLQGAQGGQAARCLRGDGDAGRQLLPLLASFGQPCRAGGRRQRFGQQAQGAAPQGVDVCLAVERRFGNELPNKPIQWLSDNGSAYTAALTRSFAREVGLEPVNTPVSSPQSNGMAESFVKTIKRDYVDFMPPDAPTAIGNLAIAFEHYNEYHPHSALRYHSPREFRRKAMATR